MPDAVLGTVTFVVTDIEGSTALLRRLGSRYGDVLADHQRLLRAAFTAAGGEEVDTQGDSFLFAFRSAGDAVAGTVEAQRSLALHEWPDGARVQVRAGIHTGEARMRDGRYVGLSVHRAARIASAAHGAQTVVSEATRALVGDLETELEEVAFRDLGRHALKDFDRPVRLYQVTAPGLVGAFPPLRTARARRRRAVAVLVALAAALAVGAVVLGTRGGSAAEAAVVRPDSLVRIDPRTNRVVSVTDVGSSPGAVVFSGGSVWILSEVDRTVSRVDPVTGEVTRVPAVLDFPCCLAAASSGGVWISGYGTRRVTLLDPVTLRAVRTLDVGTSVHGSQFLGRLPRLQTLLAAGAGSLWLVHPSRGLVRRVSARTGRTQAVHDVGELPFAIGFESGSAWVASYGADAVVEIRASDGVVASTPVPGGPASTTILRSAVWVNSYSDGKIRRVERIGGAVTDVVPAGKAAAASVRLHGLAHGFGAVWATYGEGSVARIAANDPSSVRRLALGHRAGGVAVGAGSVWVTVQAPVA